ncbi:flagellar hook-associated protein FlgK [Caldanaerobius polysaccharolyticus]|uniref:flagellar hook-associated protein FlgK n=1 Tax=Caldanaerobius polysaccharolyticus TaxID=44256 RepID=UPI0004792145|nr:flagellar hook-associated protein FlgK [Caldanaerobius polysaccharolyticus]
MSSLFYGFEIAKTGLFVSQKALDVTGHNVANVNTPGYSRQQVVLEANAPNPYFNMNTAYGSGQIGSGVSVQDISRVRDVFLDMQYRNENKGLGEWQAKSDVLSAVEYIFNEPSDTGIKTVIGQFFDSLQELSKNPESLDARALVRQRAVALADTINHMYSQLEDQQNQLKSQIQATVDQINTYARQIRDLNQQIYKFELSGDKANDLRDKRDYIVDQLSKLVNVKAYETGNGHYRVDIGGRPLVDHITDYEVSYKPDGANLSDVFTWSIDGQAVDVESGTLKGMYDMAYDNKQGIPYYKNKLDEFAYTFATKFNEIHRNGYGLDGSTGEDFFKIDTALYNDASYEGYSKVFAVSDEIQDPTDGLNKIAAAKKDDPSLPVDTGDNRNVIDLINLRYDPTVFGAGNQNKGTVDDYINSLISGLGVDSQQAKRMAENQTALTQQVDSLRQQVSGVSLDEEMTNMIKFQHSYQAAARMITAIDQMLDTLINNTGVVGR